jgi:hypothetical protein
MSSVSFIYLVICYAAHNGRSCSVISDSATQIPTQKMVADVQMVMPVLYSKLFGNQSCTDLQSEVCGG